MWQPFGGLCQFCSSSACAFLRPLIDFLPYLELRVHWMMPGAKHNVRALIGLVTLSLGGHFCLKEVSSTQLVCRPELSVLVVLYQG